MTKNSTHSYKIGVFCIPDSYYGMDFFNQLLLLIILKVHIPLGQPSLACAVLDQDEPNLAGEDTQETDRKQRRGYRQEEGGEGVGEDKGRQRVVKGAWSIF